MSLYLVTVMTLAVYTWPLVSNLVAVVQGVLAVGGSVAPLLPGAA